MAGVNSTGHDLDGAFCNTSSDFHPEKTGYMVWFIYSETKG